MGPTQLQGVAAQGRCVVGTEQWRLMLLVAQGYAQCTSDNDSFALGMAPEFAINPYGVGGLDMVRLGVTPYVVANAPLMLNEGSFRFFARVSYKIAPPASRATREKSYRPGFSPLLFHWWMDALDSGISVGLLWRQSADSQWRFSYWQTFPSGFRLAGSLSQTTLLEARQLGVQWRTKNGSWRWGGGVWATALSIDNLLIEFPLPELHIGYEI